MESPSQSQMRITEEEEEEMEEEEEEATMSVPVAVAGLVGSTLMVSLCSEYLVDAIEGVSASWGLSSVFIGIILLPIVGNAAEHMTAVTVAMKVSIYLTFITIRGHDYLAPA
eukprot:382763-Prorocentrum_minimum.AAC.2